LDHARQGGGEEGTPALEEGALSAHEEAAVAAIDHRGGAAHGTVEEAQALGRE
jgi:hypothetical protein